MKLLYILYYSEVVQRLKSEQIRLMADNLLACDGNCTEIRPDDPKYVNCPNCPLRVQTRHGIMCLHSFDKNALAILKKMRTWEDICS